MLKTIDNMALLSCFMFICFDAVLLVELIVFFIL